MAMEQKKSITLKKNNHIIDCLLSRLTDFELTTNDGELFNWCEDLRQHILDFEYKLPEKEIKKKQNDGRKTKEEGASESQNSLPI